MRRIALLIAVTTGLAHGADAPPILNDAIVKKLFGPQFARLDAAPEDVVTDSDKKEQLVSDLIGCPTREDFADDFTIADCNKRLEALRTRRTPLYLELRTLTDDLRYDFKRGGWFVTFTDSFGSYEHSLSLWKPSMPEGIRPKKCDSGEGVCYPRELSRTFKSITLFIPMDEAEARDWRDTWNERSDNKNVWLSFLVSVRQGSQWSRSYTHPLFRGEPPRTHRGLLVSIHAMSVKIGGHAWSFPEWYVAR